MRNLIITVLLMGFALPALGTEGVSAKKAATLVAQGVAELIDVREQSELEATGLAAPALWLAKSEIDARSQHYSEFLAQLDRTKTLIFYCRSGRRAAQVAEHFEAIGFRTLNMGGFAEWQQANLPVRDFNR